MEPNFQVERQIINHVVRTTGFLVILILFTGNFTLLKGFLFALAISILVFLHTLSSTKKALRLTEKSVKRFMIGRYVLHYIIYGATLAVAYKSPNLSFPGAVVGLLSIKIGLMTWAGWRTVVYFYQSGFKKYR